MSIYRTLSTILVAGALLAACANLQDLSPGVCGNGVIEGNEDCDSLALGEGLTCGAASDPAPQPCHYKCTPNDATTCPAGWSCNRENVCQHARGIYELAQGSPLALTASAYALGDMDGDGTNDVIGFAASDVQVRFGAGNGQFVSRFDVAVPTVSGPARFKQLDSDLAYDAVVPIELGLVVARGASSRNLVPVPTVVDLGEDPMMPFPSDARAQPLRRPSANLIPPSRALVFIGDAPPDASPPHLHVFSNDGVGAPVALPPGPGVRELGKLTRPSTADIDSNPAFDGDDMIIAFAGDDRVFVLGLIIDLGGPKLVQRAQVGLPAGFKVSADTTVSMNAKTSASARFVDSDGNGTLDLVIAATDPGGAERVLIAPGRGDGNFDPATPSLRFENLFSDCQTRVTGDPADIQACTRFPLAAGDLDGDGKADYLTANAVYLSGPGDVVAATTPRPSSAPWTEAVIADFNGDGAADIAAASTTETGLDILVGNDSGYFTFVRVITSGEPYSLRVGDFDGDFISDLAFAEELDAGTNVSVVFGEALALPKGAIVMGSFSSVRYCEVARISQPADLVDELIIDTSETNEMGQVDDVLLSQFFGTAERRMVSPFFFPLGPTERGQIFMAEPGRFIAAEEEGQSADIAALTRSASGLTFWILEDSISGVNPGIENQVKSIDLAGSFDLGCGLWTAGDVDGDGIDELISIDRSRSCRPNGGSSEPRLLVLDLLVNMTGGMEGFDAMTRTRSLGTALVSPQQMELADLDGDGNLDLIVAFAGQIDPRTDVCSSSGSSGVSVYWGDGGMFASTTVVPDLDASAIPAVAVANTDDDATRELVIWTSKSIVIADLDTANRTFTTSTAGITSTIDCEGQILAGDLDRDAIDDLVIGDGSNVEIQLSVPHTRPVTSVTTSP